MKRLTYKAVNAAIKEQVGDGIELVRARERSYHYFIGENVMLIDASVYVCNLNQLSLERWVAQAKQCYEKK